MRDDKLLEDLLNADSEDQVLEALNSRGLLTNMDRWRYLGDFPNNQSVVNNQQSTAMAALVEKYTNAGDAVLLRCCKAASIDPRGPSAPKSMSEAVLAYFGDISAWTDEQRRTFAEDNLLLYATGSKARPCLWLYDDGEGQLAKDFPTTFCSLIYGSDEGSYKGAIPFVQGRFNMGGTGVLPFCSDKRKLQLIVSRVPRDVAGTDYHEWAYTLMCFFPSAKDPSWRYLVGDDREVLTAGADPLKLIPRKRAKSGAVPNARERDVPSGTVIKMYDFKAPRSNICGELFRKLGEYLLQPSMPLRIIECRSEYKAKVMGVTLWDRLGALVSKSELEEGTEDGVGVTIELSTGETVPAEVRVFKMSKKKKGDDVEEARVGLRALINGQSHAKRGPEFFRKKSVGKEHIAGSMLVTLDCTQLEQQSRNDLFMANRETFRESPLRDELFRELEAHLKEHELLIYLNEKRYADKVKNAVDDESGLKAMEDLLADDPDLAELFGGPDRGASGAKNAPEGGEEVRAEKPAPFKGEDYPTYFRRKDGSTEVDVKVPRGKVANVSFLTDVRNDYFNRPRGAGTCTFSGDFKPSHRLYNGRLTFRCRLPKSAVVGTTLTSHISITDRKGSGPFTLKIRATVVPAAKKPGGKPSSPTVPKAKAGRSRPRIKELENDPTDQAITIERDSKGLVIYVNKKAQALDDARLKRPAGEAPAIEFVFKFGLALLAMSMIDRAHGSSEWEDDEAGCREQIARTVSGFDRVIVSLCLNLPKKLPKVS